MAGRDAPLVPCSRGYARQESRFEAFPMHFEVSIGNSVRVVSNCRRSTVMSEVTMLATWFRCSTS